MHCSTTMRYNVAYFFAFTVKFDIHRQSPFYVYRILCICLHQFAAIILVKCHYCTCRSIPKVLKARSSLKIVRDYTCKPDISRKQCHIRQISVVEAKFPQFHFVTVALCQGNKSRLPVACNMQNYVSVLSEWHIRWHSIRRNSAPSTDEIVLKRISYNARCLPNYLYGISDNQNELFHFPCSSPVYKNCSGNNSIRVARCR